MEIEHALVADLNRCMGCRSCMAACKQERGLGPGQNGMTIWTLGPFAGDLPPAMEFIPLATGLCNLCRHRTDRGQRPFCVEICPTQALSLVSASKLLGRLRSGKPVHLCKAGPAPATAGAGDTETPKSPEKERL